MKCSLVLVLLGILFYITESSGQSCYPDMFNNKGLLIRIETIPVSVLSDDYVGLPVYEMFGASVQCESKISFVHTVDIKHSKHYKISGLHGYQYKHGCVANGNNYRYIGSKSGLLRLNEKLAISSPHFFLVQPNDGTTKIWSAVVFGKLYPCSDDQAKVYNAEVRVDEDSKTVVEVKSLPTFNPVWPHYYMSDHGEPLSSIHVFDLEKYMHFSPSTKLTATLDDSIYKIVVEDEQLHLKTNPDSTSALLARGRFSIKNQEYAKEVILSQRTQEDKRNFLKTFFPNTIPLMEIPAGNFLNNLLSNISSIGALTMKTQHGNPRDAKTRYHFEAIAKFHQNMKSKFLKGLSFGVRISGVNLQNINVHFRYSENQCTHQHEEVLDAISNEMKKMAQKMPGETEGYYEKTIVELHSGHVCGTSDFRMDSIDLVYVDGANDRSVFKTTVKWEHHDGLLHNNQHITSAFLKFEDVVKIFFD